MEFIYDGSHLKKEKESLIIKYTNDVSVWAIYEEETNTISFQARLGEETLKDFEKFEICEAFVRGMAAYAKNEGEVFKEEEVEKIPYEVLKLRSELVKANREKEKAQQLAEKLIKGIVKKKSNDNEEKMNKVIETHVDVL